ncbi:hypothetical protein [Arthrobacter sp. ISL-95]|nr:hypothetical protein [Arthrobacter sp. ISL-95]
MSSRGIFIAALLLVVIVVVVIMAWASFGDRPSPVSSTEGAPS